MYTYIYRYICVYICIYYIYIYLYIYMYVCIYLSIYLYIYLSLSLYIYINIFLQMQRGQQHNPAVLLSLMPVSPLRDHNLWGLITCEDMRVHSMRAHNLLGSQAACLEPHAGSMCAACVCPCISQSRATPLGRLRADPPPPEVSFTAWILKHESSLDL